ncbi:MAG: polysaccharide biosynthesis/export family protein [Candidatus Eisenbacteria bacterium]
MIRFVHRMMPACLLALALVTSSAAAAPAPVVVSDTLGMDWSLVPEYRIVPGDRLSLNLGPKSDPSIDNVHEVVVRSDGRITVYPVGDVVAAGLTPMDLQRSITSLLSADFRSPRVTVEVVSTASNQVHVLGRVERPGSYPTGPFFTLTQAIAAAGGLKDDANRGHVLLIHRDGARTVRVSRVRLDRTLKGEEFVDAPVSRFDIVYVPRTSIGNLTVFLQTLFTGLSPAVSTGLLGWELFNLDRVFVTRVVKE